MITNSIHRAKQELITDHIIAIPTETVYGLAANAFSETAVHKIYTLKQRPFYNPLIVHIHSTAFLQEVAADIPEKAMQLAETFWPGPLTLVLKKHNQIPSIVTAGKDTVGVRVPNHPLTLSLLESLDFPLAAPSANPFGSISPTRADHVSNYFGNELNVILDGGECDMGIESTIIGFENGMPILYRYGSITLEDIQKVVGEVGIKTNDEKTPSAPGMLSRHYAPKTKSFFTHNLSELIPFYRNKNIGLLRFDKKWEATPIAHQEILSPKGDIFEAAKNLYSAMHRLDNAKVDVILMEGLPDEGLGKAINDKLQRASKS